MVSYFASKFWSFFGVRKVKDTRTIETQTDVERETAALNSRKRAHESQVLQEPYIKRRKEILESKPVMHQYVSDNFYKKKSTSMGKRPESFTIPAASSASEADDDVIVISDDENTGATAKPRPEVECLGVVTKSRKCPPLKTVKPKPSVSEIKEKFMGFHSMIFQPKEPRKTKYMSASDEEQHLSAIKYRSMLESLTSLKFRHTPYECRSVMRDDKPADESKEEVHIIEDNPRQTEEKPSTSSSFQFSASNLSTKVNQSSRLDSNLITTKMRSSESDSFILEQDNLLKSIKEKYSKATRERDRKIREEEIKKKIYEENREQYDKQIAERLRESLKIKEVAVEEMEEEEEEAVPLPEMTEEMMAEVYNALRAHPPNQVLCTGFSIDIKRRDMETLSGLRWLNDEVINFYFNLIMERNNNDNKYPNVYVMSTFFYPKLVKSGYSMLRRWTRKVDIFSYEMILIPVHLAVHWTLAVIHNKNKTIKFYDSMGGTNPECLRKLSSYLVQESEDKRKESIDIEEWKTESVSEIPKQKNGSDCGVFSCQFAEYASRNAAFSFTQEDMPMIRHMMVYEILHKKLLKG